MKVIPESTLSVPDEGYSRIDFDRTWWRLFQNRQVRSKSILEWPSSGTLKVDSGITFIRYAQNRFWNDLHQVRSKSILEWPSSGTLNRLWAYLMKVIPESTLSVPDEGYSRIDFDRTWWRLFQNRLWAYLMKVIPESTLIVPDEGYSRIDFERTWWRLWPQPGINRTNNIIHNDCTDSCQTTCLSSYTYINCSYCNDAMLKT
jgi:hypothetical protein